MVSTIAYPYPIHIYPYPYQKYHWFRNFDDMMDIDMDRYRQSPGDGLTFPCGRDISVPASWVMSGGRFLTQIWRFWTMKDHISLETSSNIPIFQLQNSLGKWWLKHVKTTKPMIPYDLIFLSRLSFWCFPAFLLFFKEATLPHPAAGPPRGPTPRRAWTWARLVHLQNRCIVSRHGRFSSYTPLYRW